MAERSEDTFQVKRRRMPYAAKIKRDDPFRSADKREIEAMVKRIAAAGETFAIAGGARRRASCCSTSRPGPRPAPCRTGSTAAASLTGRCRRPTAGRSSACVLDAGYITAD
jgi:hypothetical protein